MAERFNDVFLPCAPHTSITTHVERLRNEIIFGLCERPGTVFLDTLLELLHLPCFLEQRYQHLRLASIIKKNIGLGTSCLATVVTALGILEKYGRNLLKKEKPPYWECVKFQNVVFKTAVDCVQGTRDILKLLGYTRTTHDGLSIANEAELDNEHIASVTLDLSMAKMELEEFIKGKHPYPKQLAFCQSLPEHFQIPTLQENEVKSHADATGVLPKQKQNGGFAVFPIVKPTIEQTVAVTGCEDCEKTFCVNCDERIHHHNVLRHHQHKLFTPPLHPSCLKPQVTTATCDAQPLQAPSTWICQACTLCNVMPTVLCKACSRPRQSGKPPQDIPPEVNVPKTGSMSKWTCGSCTLENDASALVCLVCERPNEQTLPAHAQHVRKNATTTEMPMMKVDVKEQDVKATHEICEVQEDKFWDRERADSEAVINILRDGEAEDLSAEEVICATSTASPLTVPWLCKGGLNELLETLVVMVETQHKYIWRPSIQEARHAWIMCEGALEDAVAHCVMDRRRKMKHLQRFGDYFESGVHSNLQQTGGDAELALVELQREIISPFAERVWQDEPHNILPPGESERQMRHLLAFYDLPSWGRAMLACKVLNHVPGTDVSDVVRAVRSCTDIVAAVRYLNKECLVCSDTYPVHKMVNIIFCECGVCESCYKSHFSCIIKEKNIADLDCPICPAPTINSEENLTNLFSLLDTQFRTFVDADVYELFQSKVRDRALMMMPNFRWCANNCPNGILHDGQQLKMLCPHCNKRTCSKCKKPWEKQHEGLTCEEFTKWKHENDPEYQAAGLAAYLAENGIDCPKCKYRYALAKGGCMHFTCKQCKHAFCCCCNNAFLHEEACHAVRGGNCQGKGLHAHHPRTCLYFLRDWDVEQLQRLLKDEDVPFNTQPPRGAHHTGRCHVMEQKDDPNGFRDEECGREVPDYQAGLCTNHYKEYLVSLITRESLDPVALYLVKDATLELQRNDLPLPPQKPNESQEDYLLRLKHMIQEKIPLKGRDENK
uniref:E3 ubiquitin-protein ligase RNF31 isoform X2 n=1 Tax=Myxine glutinosa TaxID=7769 RepID=UPI00358DE18C